jgi:hypothetical protein
MPIKRLCLPAFRLALIVTLALSSTASFAASRRQPPVSSTWRARVEAEARRPAPALVVNDVVVVRFRSWRGGLSPMDRAETAAERLRGAVANGLRAGGVSVDAVSDPDGPRLKAMVETIAVADAAPIPSGGSRRRRARLLRAARSEAQSVAEGWATNLRRALAIPGIAVVGEPGHVLPLGEAYTVRVRGAAQGPITITSAAGNSPRLVGVQVNETTGTLSLTGLKPGREVLTLEREGAVAPLYVWVKPYAGQFSAPRTVTVTGSEVPFRFIAQQAKAAALATVTLTPGAVVRITGEPPSVPDLTEGKAIFVPVPMRLTGIDMLPVERKVFVPVVNRAITTMRATTLFYSNNPERLERPQTLFVGRMSPGGNGAVRLLYHHQNDSGQPLRFTAELVNDGDAPSRVHVVGGDAGPERDTVWVGFRAASDYVRAEEDGVGTVVEVPPHTHVPLSSLRLPPGLTISGLMQMRVLSGAPPLVRVAAEDMPASGDSGLAFLPLPLDDVRLTAARPDALSGHVYPEPSKRLEAEYTVGGKWTFVPVGRSPLQAAKDPETLLHGNYGVLYDIAVNIQNPTAQVSTARVVFEPSAGMAGGVFLISGKRVEIPRSNMPDETTLTTVTLAPGESKSVHIRTLPLSGSNYPATLIVRP